MLFKDTGWTVTYFQSDSICRTNKHLLTTNAHLTDTFVNRHKHR